VFALRSSASVQPLGFRFDLDAVIFDGTTHWTAFGQNPMTGLSTHARCVKMTHSLGRELESST
jgi:hypothetical protein